MDVADAEQLARQLLAPLPRRLAHVSSVAQLAGTVAAGLGISAQPVVSGAWLHDIGYAREASATGFHALDGARFLRLAGVAAPVRNLVAHHSFALVEAGLRGFRTELETEFPYDAALPHEVLCYCDMTTGPVGERVSVDERLREIRERYGPEALVTDFIDRAATDILKTVSEVEKRLAGGVQSR